MRRILVMVSAVAFSASLIGCAVPYPAVTRTALPKSHPLIGSWKLNLPQMKCFEVYTIRPDGTASVTSGAQAAESEFELSAYPGSTGFYKWVDKIIKDNGKPDCMGAVMEVGHVATSYIAIHRTGKMFLMCEKERLNTCIGPFVRLEDL